MSKTRTFTEEQFVEEAFAAGFLGVYKFWCMVIAEDYPLSNEKLQARGERLLREIARQALMLRGARRFTEQEREAYHYCGIETP